MKYKIISLLLAAFFAPTLVSAALPFVGMYQTIDDETSLPKSIVALYEYDNKLAGRIVALYGADGTISETMAAPVRVAENVSGAPKYVGLDIIWGMTWDSDDSEYADGKIMDPAKGKVYSSVIWQDSDKSKLRVRGKIGPFGRTQNWNVLNVSDLPAQLRDVSTDGWAPIIRK